ncbi:MAG: hypothetical protein ASARMPRED_005421 [Alectoria sarmentosa]|nr:MAG: hypothetical protein ASARMPRED_005421 [Alectoria sarmentosa]
MISKTSSKALGPVLVIGGCGFVGFHIVHALLQDPTCGPVSVVSRNPNLNRCEGASYHTGDICDLTEFRNLVGVIKPRVIFHAASPRGDDPTVEPGDHYNISVEGTRNVLICATESPTVKALVYTSTCAVSKGYQHFNIDETAPLWEQDSKTIPYFKAKALADTLTCEANFPLDRQNKGLLTATLRLPWVYGERDNQAIPGMLKTAEEGQTKIQLGDNKNLVEPTYVGNAATAHLLAAKKLLESESGSLDPKVDGEAFHITDGDPQPFWTFARMIWRTAGDQTNPDQVTTIPGWLALSMAHGIDWAYFLCTFGRVRPPLNTSPLYIQYTIYNATYDVSKARTRLGYAPVVDKVGHLKSSVAWEFENHEGKYKKLLRK